jgi:hypothetical protein
MDRVKGFVWQRTSCAHLWHVISGPTGDSHTSIPSSFSIPTQLVSFHVCAMCTQCVYLCHEREVKKKRCLFVDSAGDSLNLEYVLACSQVWTSTYCCVLVCWYCVCVVLCQLSPIWPRILFGFRFLQQSGICHNKRGRGGGGGWVLAPIQVNNAGTLLYIEFAVLHALQN